MHGKVNLFISIRNLFRTYLSNTIAYTIIVLSQKIFKQN